MDMKNFETKKFAPRWKWVTVGDDVGGGCEANHRELMVHVSLRECFEENGESNRPLVYV